MASPPLSTPTPKLKVPASISITLNKRRKNDKNQEEQKQQRNTSSTATTTMAADALATSSSSHHVTSAPTSNAVDVGAEKKKRLTIILNTAMELDICGQAYRHLDNDLGSPESECEWASMAAHPKRSKRQPHQPPQQPTKKKAPTPDQPRTISVYLAVNETGDHVLVQANTATTTATPAHSRCRLYWNHSKSRKPNRHLWRPTQTLVTPTKYLCRFQLERRAHGGFVIPIAIRRWLETQSIKLLSYATSDDNNSATTTTTTTKTTTPTTTLATIS